MADTNKEAYVLSTTENQIATIEFFHPQSNSLPGKILNQLAVAVQTAGNDNNVNVIILKSAGEKAFCAGASFDELLQINSTEQGLEF